MRIKRHSGFTLMEMLFSLVTLAVIGTAVTAMLVAAGDAWDTRDDYRKQVTDARSVMANLTEWVRGSQRVVSAPVAADAQFAHLVIWHNDDQFEDVVNLSELRVITYDASAQTLTLYAAELTDAQKLSAGSNPSFTPATVGGSGFPISFAGRNDTNAYVMAENMSDFLVTLATPADGEPSYRLVELRMVLAGPGGAEDQMELTTAFVRAPDYDLDFEN